ncbi:hypothetical protein HHI36_005598, partial [Cryptolaemus montrouzieri]
KLQISRAFPAEINTLGANKRNEEVRDPYEIVDAFRVVPSMCAIPRDKEQEFKVIFHPSKNMLHECILKANMKNLDPNTSDLEITLKGETQQFPYQFQSIFIEDFKLSDLRFRTYCGYMTEENAKILHFLSLGVGSECN